MTRNKLISLLLILGLIAFLTSCSKKTNIFGWVYPNSNKNANVSALIQSGEIALQSGNYQGALNDFASAMAQSPKSSQARWGYVRAYVLINNAASLYMLSQLMGNKNLAIAFNTTWFAAPRGYNYGGVINTIINTLDNPTYSIVNNLGDGTIPPNDFQVNLNLGIAYAFSAFATLGDSSHDAANGGSFFDNNDVLVLGTGSSPLQVNQAAITQMISKFPIASEITNLNPVNITKPELLTILSNMFEISSSALTISALIGTVANDLTRSTFCFQYGVIGTISPTLGQTNNLVKSMNNQVNSINNQIATLIGSVTGDAPNLNNDQFQMVGHNAYSSTYTSYTTNNNTWFYYNPGHIGAGSLVDQVNHLPAINTITCQTVQNVITLGLTMITQIQSMQLK